MDESETAPHQDPDLDKRPIQEPDKPKKPVEPPPGGWGRYDPDKGKRKPFHIPGRGDKPSKPPAA